MYRINRNTYCNKYQSGSFPAHNCHSLRIAPTIEVGPEGMLCNILAIETRTILLYGCPSQACSNHFILGLNVSASIPVHRLIIAPCRYPNVIMHACSVAQSCLTLCNPMNCSPPGSSGIFQARILEWVAIYFSRGSSQLSDQTCISCIGRWILYH